MSRCEKASDFSDWQTSFVRLWPKSHEQEDWVHPQYLFETVATHRAATMRKLHLSFLAGLVRHAVRNGLVEP